MRKLSERKKKWIERTIANDRSYKVVLYNRFFLLLTFILAQLIGYAVLLYFLVYNSTVAFALQIVVLILELVFVLYLLNKHERPSTRLNWIILILFVPVFGVPMYLVNGGGRPTRRMHKKCSVRKRKLKKNCAIITAKNIWRSNRDKRSQRALGGSSIIFPSTVVIPSLQTGT